ncbi:hypothetical protein GLU01_01680 [Nanohaloarchaea archaeon]|nr:hypothetical protein [Candidatus Nanohaloarchaea archaeon]
MNKTAALTIVIACVGMLAAPAAAQYGDDTAPEEQDPEQQDQEPEEQEDQIEDEQENELEENETEEQELETEGIDDNTALTVSESDARNIARQSLSDNNWVLEESSVEEDEGYYRFRYIIQGTDSEAEVRIDGSSGEVFRREEELEPGNQQIEQVETAQVTSLQEARDRIRDLRETITELRRENARLRSADSGGPPESAEDGGREREPGIRRGPNETEVEAEAEVNGSEVEVEAERTGNQTEPEVEVEGQQGPPEREQTPGSDTARQNRPGFVNRVLSGIFG